MRPQSQQRKQAQKMLEALKKGDRVTTVGGIRGVVVAVRDSTVTLKVDTATKIEFNKSAISSLLDPKESPPPEKPEKAEKEE
jgi:preprotein translocase subunit YajC